MIKLIDTKTNVAEIWAWVEKVKADGQWQYDLDRSVFGCIFKFESTKYDFYATYIVGDFFEIHCSFVRAEAENEVKSIFMQLINES